MTLVMPLSLEDFFDRLPIKQVSFSLSEALEGGETAGGDSWNVDYGARLWGGKLSVSAETYREAERIGARAGLIRRGGASFLVTPSSRSMPAGDPTGSILGSASPVITDIVADNQAFRIAGLPPGYVISEGDYLSYTYGSTPRYGFHKVYIDAVADASGVIPELFVDPVPFALVANRPVRLVKPVLKAHYKRGSFEEAVSVADRTFGFKFEWGQTLR